jgi:hypothetical protein
MMRATTRKRMQMDPAMRRWFAMNLPSSVEMLVDGEAIEAWIERNPAATVDEARQLVDAPDNLIDLTPVRATSGLEVTRDHPALR